MAKEAVWLSGVLDARWPLLALGLYVAAVGINALRPRLAAPRPLAAPWAHGMGFGITGFQRDRLFKTFNGFAGICRRYFVLEMQALQIMGVGGNIFYA